jgi:hypothetical protein
MGAYSAEGGHLIRSARPLVMRLIYGGPFVATLVFYFLDATLRL